jgi:O-antigen/teichoic acid export membrane protein
MKSLTFKQFKAGVWRRLHNRHLWQAGGLLMLANVIVMALGLVRTPAMTWVIPKEQIGMMGILAAWLPFVQLLSLPGLDSASYHFVAKGQPWAFVVNVIHRLRWSLLSVMALLGGGLYWWYTGEPGVAWLFMVTAVSYPVTIGLTAAGGMLAAQENFKGLFWYRIWESLTDFIGFIPILLSLWWINQIVTFYAANQLATAVMMVAYVLWLIHTIKKRGERPLPAGRQTEVVRYGQHLTVISGIGVIQSRIDAVLVAFLFPLETIADYAIALLVYEQLKRLWNIYLAIRYPVLVRLPLARRYRRLIWEGLATSLLFAVTGLALAVAIGFLLPIVLPPAYASSLPYINWLIATIVAMIPGGFAEMYFRMEQDEKGQYTLRIISAIMGVLMPVSLLILLDTGAIAVVTGRFCAAVGFSIAGIWLVYRQHLSGTDATIE